MFQFDLDIKPASQQFKKGSEEKQKIIQHNFNLIQQQLYQQQIFDDEQQQQQDDDNFQQIQNQQDSDYGENDNQYQANNSQNEYSQNLNQQQIQNESNQMQYQIQNQENSQDYQQYQNQQNYDQNSESNLSQYRNMYNNENYQKGQKEDFQNSSQMRKQIAQQDQNEENNQFLNDQEKQNSSDEEEELVESEQSNLESDEQDDGQILDMSIDLGDDNVKNLIVYENDDPTELAQQFVVQNQLNEDAIQYLSQSIFENMQAALQEREEKRKIKDEEKEQKRIQKEQKKAQKIQEIESKKKQKLEKKQMQELEQQQLQNDRQSQQRNDHDQHEFQNQSQENSQLNQNNQSSVDNLADSQQYQTIQAQQQPFFGTYNQFYSASKGRIPVHDRLYLEAQQKEIRSQQRKQLQINQHNETHKSIHTLKSPSVKKIGNQRINHGEYLYYSALQKKEEKEQYNKRVKQLQEQQEQQKTTFHPQICQKSIILAEQKKQFALPEDRFRENQYFSNKKKEELRIAVKNRELEECSFHPQINNVSAKIQEIKQKQGQENFNRFQLLFDEAKDRQWRLQEKKLEIQQAELSQMQPQIFSRPPLNDDKIPFLERLEKQNKERLYKSQKINIYPMVNEKDLQECVFKPKVGRAPLYERNSDNKPIGEYLNSQKNNKQIIQETLLLKDQELQQSMMYKPLSVSSNILNEKKYKIFEELFNILDSDGDGEISNANHDISKLNNQILTIFAVFFQNMQQQQLKYNLEQFQIAATQYVDKLSFQERMYIYNDSKYKWKLKQQQPDPNFKPKPEINQNSQKIVEKNRKKNNIVKNNLYLSGLRQKQLKEAKIQQQQQENEQKQLQGCSFQPTLTKPLPIYSFSKMQSKKQASQNQQNQNTGQPNMNLQNSNELFNTYQREYNENNNNFDQNQQLQLQPQFSDFLKKLSSNLSPQNKLTVTQQLQMSNQLQISHNKNLEISNKISNLVKNQHNNVNFSDNNNNINSHNNYNAYEQQLTEQLYNDEQEQLDQFSQYEKMLEVQNQQSEEVL